MLATNKMMTTEPMTNPEVLSAMKALSHKERGAQSAWLRNLAEVERRELYLEAGFDSLWRYVHRGLGYSEGSTSKRIQVMRACRKFPVLYDLLSQCRISLSVISRLSPYLCEELIHKAQGMSTAEVEKLIATIAPKPDVADKITPLTVQDSLPLSPAPDASTAQPKPEPKAKVEPLSEKRDLYRFTAGESFAQKLQRAKELLAGKNLEALFEQALEDLLHRRDPAKKLFPAPKPTKPRKARPVKKHTRYIPREIRRMAWKESDSCSYISASGQRCGSRTGLQFDHILAFGLGGSSLDPRNIRVLCSRHNQWLGRRSFPHSSPVRSEPSLRR